MDFSVTTLIELPYTISYVIRKRIQVSNLHELPKEKRPPDLMIWDGTSEDLDDWLEKVYGEKKQPLQAEFIIDEKEIEYG